MLRKVTILTITLLTYSLGYSQNITPKGYFLQDSVQIGEPVPFILSIKYPKELEVIFPDSLHNFSPFELTKKVYFPTYSDSIISTDSAIYYLSTFEIDTVQYLKLPVYLINQFDSTTLWTTLDSVVLNQVVRSIPDSVAMLTNTTYMAVPMAFNYPYATIGFVILLVFSIAIWLLFGKSIKKKIKLYRIKKKYLKFMLDFDKLLADDYTNCEVIISKWKGYLEKLTSQPYSKLTTKEIVAKSKHTNMEAALMAIDRNIYGPKDESLLTEAYLQIKQIVIAEYNNKVNEIANG